MGRGDGVRLAREQEGGDVARQRGKHLLRDGRTGPILARGGEIGRHQRELRLRLNLGRFLRVNARGILTARYGVEHALVHLLVARQSQRLGEEGGVIGRVHRPLHQQGQERGQVGAVQQVEDHLHQVVLGQFQFNPFARHGMGQSDLFLGLQIGQKLVELGRKGGESLRAGRIGRATRKQQFECPLAIGWGLQL